jgi:hypothetical protein
MKTRVLCGVVVILLLGSAGSAQSISELLQRGIYTQETVGDVEAAIRIYQQVIAATQQASELRAQAQRRLQAAERQLVEARLRSEGFIRARTAGEPLGTFDGRTYRHTWTGTTFAVPDGWHFDDTVPSSDNGEMAYFTSKDGQTHVAVWMIKEKTPRADVSARLDGAPAQKITQRLGFEGYHYREGSIQRLPNGPHQALVAIAEYTEGSRSMTEYLTWIYTETARVFFFTRVPAAELDRIRPLFDGMVYSAIIP